jgi:hypothetical protein
VPYIYRVSRRTTQAPASVGVSITPEPEAPEPSYRDLQAQAKALDIPANQSADDLKKAIAEAANG